MHFLHSTDVDMSKPENEELRKQFLLPWINKRVLSTDASVLFALLHVRTKYRPQDWAAFDDSQLVHSCTCGHLSLQVFPAFVVMYGSRYGYIVPPDIEAASRREIVAFHAAFLVLEAQANLMSLLSNIVDGIVPGDSDTSATHGCKRWNAEVSKGFKHASKPELWSMFTNQPFSPPPRLNLDHITGITRARREGVADHLHELQTCPAYLRCYLKDIYDTFNDNLEDRQYEVVGAFLHAESLDYCEWLLLEEECLRAKQCFCNSTAKLNRGERLLEFQERALGRLQYSFGLRLLTICTDLYHQISHCNEFQHLFHHGQYLKKHGWREPFLVAKYTLSKMYSEDRLACYLICIGRIGWEECEHFETSSLFAALEYHLHANPMELKRIPTAMMHALSKAAAASEGRHYLQLHRGNWPRKFIVSAAKDDKDVDPKFLRGEEYPRSIILGAEALVVSFYKRPAPNGPRNEARLKETKLQRQAVQYFWECVKNSLMTTRYYSDYVKLKALPTISVSSTAEYAEMLRKEEESFKQVVVPKAGTDALTPQYQTGVENLKSTLEQTAISSKVKTRGPALN